MPHILEKNVLLSESIIWRQQKDFYSSEGLAAWDNKIPFYVTSNPFIANQYAEMFAQFMHEWTQENPNNNEPFYIIELGAGSGQFGFYFIKYLLQQLKKFRERIKFKYVMTDFNQNIIDSWMSQPNLHEYIENGILDFARYDVLEYKPIVLQRGAEILSNLKTPLLTIANYVIDSLPADLMSIEDGVCAINSVTTSVEHEDDKVSDFDNVKLQFNVEKQTDNIYDEDKYNKLLEFYSDNLLDTHFLFPVKTLDAIQFLQTCSNNGVVLIASDKAYTSLSELDHLGYPQLSAHGGCFSIMANFDSVARFALMSEGSAILQDTRSGIRTGVFSFNTRLESMQQTCFMIQEKIRGFCAGDYLNLYRNMVKHKGSWSLEALASQLALSKWDPHSFAKVHSDILLLLDGADVLTVENLATHMHNIAENYYQMKHAPDVFFLIAIFFHSLKRYRDALPYYKMSEAYFEPIFSLFFNMAVCYFYLNDKEKALALFEKAQLLEPNNNKLQEWFDKF